MTRLPALPLALLVLLIPSLAGAGAWTAPAGSIYAKLSYAASSANDQYGFGGQSRPIVEGVSDYPFADRSVSIYTEYGLRDRLTLIGQVPFKRIFVHDRFYRYRTTGVGDLGAGLRYRLFQRGSWVGSATASASLPSGYGPTSRPPLGAGALDLYGGAELGRSFFPFPGYANARLGYGYRASARALNSAGASVIVNYADQLRYGMEAGWTVASRVTLRILARGVYALRAAGTSFTITSIPSSERYLKLGLGGSVRLHRHLDIEAEYAATPAGRNTARSTDITLGLATSW